MISSIKKFEPDQEYYFEEGCHIVEISNSVDDEEVSIAQARVEPGQQTKWHSLADTTERYVVLQGVGLVEIGDCNPVEVTSGDVVIIPAQTRQRISNIGAEDLKFLAICAPRFKQSNYQQH
ncbi:MAG: cupin domain-containing protein [Pseudohongiella sp.]|nr:cupin domain-containing protein [Pseudohongiella sp.]